MMVAAGLLSACGGGGSDSYIPSNPDSDLKSGIYSGTTARQQQVLSLIAPKGEYWILYSKKDTPSEFEGFLQGKLDSTLKKITDENGKAYVFNTGVSAAQLLGSHNITSAKVDSFSLNPPERTNSFDLTFNNSANQARPSLASVSGNYTTTLYTTKGILANSQNIVLFKVGQLGGIVGSMPNLPNCGVEGQVKQDTTAGNYFVASLQFIGTGCGTLLNGKTFSGPALFYKDAEKPSLVFPSITEDRNQGIIIAGSIIMLTTTS